MATAIIGLTLLHIVARNNWCVYNFGQTCIALRISVFGYRFLITNYGRMALFSTYYQSMLRLSSVYQGHSRSMKMVPINTSYTTVH